MEVWSAAKNTNPQICIHQMSRPSTVARLRVSLASNFFHSSFMPQAYPGVPYNEEP